MIEFDKKQRIYPAFSKGRFYNYPGEKKHHFLLPSLRMMLSCHLKSVSARKEDIEPWLGFSEIAEKSQELSITWIGHSTFLIQIGGYNILTDPIFGNLPLFRRITPPGIALHTLPPIDFVLISHNHRDHMDADTLKELFKRNPSLTFLVPQGDAHWFKKRGIRNVKEHMWWDEQSYHSFMPLKLTFLPAFHWSQRGFFDFNRSLWGSWMIECHGKRLYFAGDTAYASHFKVIGEAFPLIDIALMPIGPCEPRTWMTHAHVSAEEAGQAFIDLGAHHFIPMHWGTYYFGLDTFDLPYKRLSAWWHAQNMHTKKLCVLKIGESLVSLPEESSQHILQALQSAESEI